MIPSQFSPEADRIIRAAAGRIRADPGFVHDLDGAVTRYVATRWVQLSPEQQEITGHAIISALMDMGEMAEEVQERLQSTMDRRSKAVEALRNIMQKLDSTDQAITDDAHD